MTNSGLCQWCIHHIVAKSACLFIIYMLRSVQLLKPFQLQLYCFLQVPPFPWSASLSSYASSGFQKVACVNFSICFFNSRFQKSANKTQPAIPKIYGVEMDMKLNVFTADSETLYPGHGGSVTNPRNTGYENTNPVGLHAFPHLFVCILFNS